MQRRAQIGLNKGEVHHAKTASEPIFTAEKTRLACIIVEMTTEPQDRNRAKQWPICMIWTKCKQFSDLCEMRQTPNVCPGS